MKRNVLMPLLAAFVAASLPAGAGEITVYSQLPDPSDGGAQSSAEPYAPSGGWHSTYKSADEFVLSAPAAVQKVRWWGHSYDGRHGDTDTIDQVSGFRVEFFATGPGGGIPGESIHAETITAAGAHASATSYESITGCQIYEHWADLSAPVQLSAGTEYWLSISAYLDSPPMWVWLAGASGNRNYAVDIGVDGTWGDQSWPSWYMEKDMSFELIVPEPATLSLLALGGVGLGRRRRRLA